MLSIEEFGDGFSKRQPDDGSGRRSSVKVPPSGRSKSNSRVSRRKSLDPSMLSGSRGLPVPQVAEVGCGCKTWNKFGLGMDLTTSTSISDSTRRSGDNRTAVSSSTAICNRNLAKSVSGIFFRRVKTAPPPTTTTTPSPKLEEQWSSFREQHQQEMNEMKQMYSALQSMCQEIKTITGIVSSPAPKALTWGESTTPTSTYSRTPTSTYSRTPTSYSVHSHSPLRLTKAATMNYSEKKAPPEKPSAIITPRRARSVPRSRRSAYSHPPARDLTHSVNLFFRSPWTDITASLFEEIVQVQKTFLRSFCQSMAKHRDEELNPSPSPRSCLNPNPNSSSDVVSALVTRLLPHTSFAKSWHLKYAVEAWINRMVLGDFSSESYGLDDDDGSGNDAATADGFDPTALSPWDEYQRLALLSPSDAINPACRKAGSYHERFHLFCNRKFQAIHEELRWWEEWPVTLVEEFLEAMKHVWRAHKLAFAFDTPAAIFCVKASTAFDPNYMEPVLEVSQFDSSTFSSKVGFMVTPGFLVNGQVIKSQVYLMPQVDHIICSASK